MVDYTPDAIDAAKEFKENGMEILYRSITSDPVYDESIGEYITSFMDYETYALRTTIKVQQMPAGYVQKPGDMVFYIGGLEIPEPKVGDLVILKNKVLSVFNFETFAPGEIPIYHIVYVRGDNTENGGY